MPSFSFLSCSDRLDAIHPFYCCSRDRLGICHTVTPVSVSVASTRHVGLRLPSSIHPVKGGRVGSGVSAMFGPSCLGFACWEGNMLNMFLGVVCKHVGFRRGPEQLRHSSDNGVT